MKFKNLLYTGIALFITAGGAVAQTDPGQTATAEGGGLSAADRKFIHQAATGGMSEVEEGQLAQEKAESPDVKAFGQQMVTDHTEAGEKLKSVAQGLNAPLPTELDKAQKKREDALKKLTGRAFERRYVQDEVADHKAAVALFEKEAASGSNPALKQFASDTLPTLRQHLTHVEELAKN